jgi:opacity protein-like surface antigen
MTNLRYVMQRALLLLGIIVMLAGNALAGDMDDPYGRENAISVKVGRSYTEKSDFSKFWELDDAVVNNVSVAYERKLWRYVGVELAGGYASLKESSNNIFLPADSLRTKLRNYTVALSGKLYLPPLSRLSLYVGGGPSYYHTDADFSYSSFRFTRSDSFNTYGLHALAGAEVILSKGIGGLGKHGVYDAPVGLFVEYGYAWVNIEEADEKPIWRINRVFGTSFTNHDFNVGGHSVSVGLRWHF